MLTLYVLDVTAENGVPFRVLAIPASAEGPNPHRAPADRGYPLVEFYDQRYPHTEHGQFVSCYRLDTILGRDGYGPGTGGIDLDSGIPDWTVDGRAMFVVRTWLQTLDERKQLQ